MKRVIITSFGSTLPCNFYHIFILCIVFIIFVTGCDENDMYYKSYEIFNTKDGNKIKLKNDTVCTFYTDEFQPFNTEIVNKDEVENLKRFIDKKEDQYWMIAVFGEWCERMGLNPKIKYLIKREYYFQFIPVNPNKVPVPYIPDGSKMGLYNKNGMLCIGYQCGTGGSLIDGKIGNCMTTIIHIGYDDEGNNVDKYFPCNPYELDWYYSWYNY